MRLLSFLTEIEHALIADDPSPLGGAWEANRSVNYHQGIARLSLAVRAADGAVLSQGAVMIQQFQLADGSACVKAYLSWAGASDERVRSIYETPDTDWSTEARRTAAAWLAGREKSANVETAIPGVLAASA